MDNPDCDIVEKIEQDGKNSTIKATLKLLNLLQTSIENFWNQPLQINLCYRKLFQ